MIDAIKRRILIKLNKMRKWGKNHTTDIRNVRKGMPLSVTPKLIKKAIKELNNERLLLGKKSVGSTHVYLNPEYMKEIMEFIEK